MAHLIAEFFSDLSFDTKDLLWETLDTNQAIVAANGEMVSWGGPLFGGMMRAKVLLPLSVGDLP